MSYNSVKNKTSKEKVKELKSLLNGASLEILLKATKSRCLFIYSDNADQYRIDGNVYTKEELDKWLEEHAGTNDHEVTFKSYSDNGIVNQPLMNLPENSTEWEEILTPGDDDSELNMPLQNVKDSCQKPLEARQRSVKKKVAKDAEEKRSKLLSDKRERTERDQPKVARHLRSFGIGEIERSEELVAIDVLNQSLFQHYR